MDARRNQATIRSESRDRAIPMQEVKQTIGLNLRSGRIKRQELRSPEVHPTLRFASRCASPRHNSQNQLPWIWSGTAIKAPALASTIKKNCKNRGVDMPVNAGTAKLYEHLTIP
jgi:hypothetical protein